MLKKFIHLLLLVPFLLYSTSSNLIKKSLNDKNIYKKINLSNGMDVVLVSNANFEKSAAAMLVKVGSFADPSKFPGMAHFLEHMLFLGTKKYPKEGTYQRFIEKNGGIWNAYTSSTNTVYFFDVIPHAFNEALDIFSQFFINPLFNPQLVEKEKNAVNSEYNMHLQNNSMIRYDILKQHVNPEHPLSKFSIGTIETLSSKKGENIRDELINFYNKHYYSNNMILSLSGPETIEELEVLANNNFNKVQANTRDNNNISAVPMFTKNNLQKTVEYRTHGKNNSLDLIFSIKNMHSLYKTNPYGYLENLFNSKHPNSISAYLFDNGFINEKPSLSFFDTYNQGFINISANLTAKGLKEVDHIIQAIMNYFKLCREEAISKERYEEYKNISQVLFDNKSPDKTINLVKNTVNNAYNFPINDINTAEVIFEEFDYDKIYQAISSINVSNMMVLIGNENITSSNTTKYFNTQYKTTNFTPKQIELWNNNLDTALQLPNKNNYISNMNNVQKLDNNNEISNYPKLIYSTDNKKLWCINNYKDTDKNNVGKIQTAKILFEYILRPSFIDNSAQNQAEAELLNNILSMYIQDKFYDAILAGNNISIKIKIPHGIKVYIESYSQDIVNAIVSKLNEELKNFHFEEDIFTSQKELLLEKYYNYAFENPYKLSFQSISDILIKNQHSMKEIYNSIKNVSSNDLYSLINNLLSNVSFEGLLSGNVNSSDDHSALTKTAAMTLTNRNINYRQSPIAKLKQKKHMYNMSSNHADKSISLLFQFDNYGDRTQVLGKLIQSIISEPFFTDVRTNQQMGYIVFTYDYKINQTSSIVYNIESPTVSTYDMYSAVLNFIDKMQAKLDNMSVKQLNTYKYSLSKIFQQSPQNIYELHNRTWGEIYTQKYEFDIRKKLDKELRTITLAELRESFNKLHNNIEKVLLVKTEDIENLNFKDFNLISSISKFKDSIEYFD